MVRGKHTVEFGVVNMYFVATSDIDGSSFIVKPSEESTLWIPMDDANADYQEYLAWVAEGNEAEQWA